MSVRTLVFILIFCCGLLPITSYAQLTLSAEVRPRAEYRNGFKTVRAPKDEPAFFVEQRSRLYTRFERDKLKLKLTFQDIRIWGNTSQVYKADASMFNIYEGYGEYLFTPRFSIRVGRQELDYDNARFLGNLDWAQQGRSHDALKFMFKDSTGLEVHAGAGFNQSVAAEPAKLFDTFYSGHDNYKTMQFVWGHKAWEKGKVSALLFNDGRQKPDSTIAFRQTYGVLGDIKLGKVKWAGEVYYQGGRDVPGKRIRAFMAAASATLQTTFTPVTLGIDYLSGTARGHSQIRSFVPLYGTNHAFYGHMDYFYVGNFHGQEGRNTGLTDLYLKTNFKLGAKNSLLLHLHHFRSPVRVYEQATSEQQLSGRLGEEIDLVYTHLFASDFNFKIGYSQLYATQTLEALKNKSGSNPNHWAWVMMTFSPTLLKQ